MIDTDLTSKLSGRPAITTVGLLGALWGIAGAAFLLASCIYRLAPVIRTAFAQPLHWYHWLALLLTIILMAYYEGYRGFQKGFSPRVAARARHLARHPHPLHLLLGPLFCIGYFHTTRRRQAAVIAITTGIIVLVLLVRLIDQPWRGIIDTGVVVGMLWGLASLLTFSYLAFTQPSFDHSPELPD
jgi:hypothetical protein